jgi:AraC-like DNA-binding protein
LILAQIAACAGFSDQRDLSQHFKGVVGVTPRQFRAVLFKRASQDSLARAN